jgi:hypothetical protein
MKFYIYGLRLKGSHEVRYIGQTVYDPAHRLTNHFLHAKQHMRPTTFVCWLLENGENVEAFKIALVESREEARGTERAVIALCLRLNHRLFNRHGVPADLRQPKYPIAVGLVA